MTANIVEIRRVDVRHDFYINDILFHLKGAGIDSKSGYHVQALAAAEANAFRTWRTDHAEQELAEALKYNLKVAVGIDMLKELHGLDYTNSQAITEQLERIKIQMLKYKDHPAVLCWVVGNELNRLPLAPNQGNTAFSATFTMTKKQEIITFRS